jgi:cytoplasmic iron level regulating protein YaaA (DUF328/UPF0246 family)
VLILLSPAKKLDETSAWDHTLPVTEPALLKETRMLHRVVKKLKARDLAALMDLSETLAELNRERFQDWTPEHTPDNARPAILTFAGDVYTGLNGPTLDQATLLHAQQHLAILSGFYGVLRPLDLMQAYRLEMGTAVATTRGRNLYQFWDTRIAAEINRRIADHRQRVIVNLASAEYFKAVPTASLKAPVIEAQFREIKNGKPQMMMVFAKRARGAMARWMLENRIDDPKHLKDFDVGGYTFDKAASDATCLQFTRPWTGAAPADD